MDQTTDISSKPEKPLTHFNAMPVQIRGKVYPSHKEAAKALGVTPAAISQRLHVNGHAETVGLGLSGGQKGNKNGARELTLAGFTFPSRKDAAKALGVTRSQLTKWISANASAAQKEMLVAALMQYAQKCANKR